MAAKHGDIAGASEEFVVRAPRASQTWPNAVRTCSRNLSATFGPCLDSRKLAPLHQDYLYRAIGFSSLILLTGLALLAAWSRQQRLYDAVARSEQERQALIDQIESEKVRAYRLASHDYLTGIPNRMLLYDLASAELLRAKRSRNLHALMFFDLDKFKLINDTWAMVWGISCSRRSLRACGKPCANTTSLRAWATMKSAPPTGGCSEAGMAPFPPSVPGCSRWP